MKLAQQLQLVLFALGLAVAANQQAQAGSNADKQAIYNHLFKHCQKQVKQPSGKRKYSDAKCNRMVIKAMNPKRARGIGGLKSKSRLRRSGVFQKRDLDVRKRRRAWPKALVRHRSMKRSRLVRGSRFLRR